MAEIKGMNPNFHLENNEPETVSPLISGFVDEVYQSILDKGRQESQEKIKQLEKQALIDKMTGYSSRNAWQNHVEHFGYRHDDKATIILCDLNGLKRKNDTQGHGAGDVEIKKTASFLKESFNRSKDMFFRIGGDEFVILLDGVDDIESLKKYVDTQFSPENQKKRGVDFAYGIARFDPTIDIEGIDIADRKEDEKHQTTFDRADAAMYAMKANQKSQ